VTCRGIITDEVKEKAGKRVSLSIWMEKGRQLKVVVGKASGVKH